MLDAPISALEAHVGNQKEPSFGSIHVQTDDVDAVVRAVRQFVPRLPGGSQGSVVLSPRDGWTSAYDELTDREPEMLRRLARELSDRMGSFVIVMGVEEGRVVRYVALERGRAVDEYLSVPEYYGPLPPGEVIALGANPRLMARLTGADADARATARTAIAPEELPSRPSSSPTSRGSSASRRRASAMRVRRPAGRHPGRALEAGRVAVLAAVGAAQEDVTLTRMA